MPLYYLFLEFFFRKSIQSYKIQPKVNLGLSEVFRCYKSVMRMFILVVGPLQLVSYPSVKVKFLSLVSMLLFTVFDVDCYGKKGLFFCNVFDGVFGMCFVKCPTSEKGWAICLFIWTWAIFPS